MAISVTALRENPIRFQRTGSGGKLVGGIPVLAGFRDSPARVRRSPLLPIFLVVLVDVLGFTIVYPLLPFYAEHFDASPLVATTLVSVYALCSLFSTPVLGRILDGITAGNLSIAQAYISDHTKPENRAK